MIAFECYSLTEMPAILRERTFISHDFRSFVRTSGEDYRRIAGIVSERLSHNGHSTVILIPQKGWSKADIPGGPFHSPETNEIFTSELKSLLNSHVRFEEVDAHINEELCAKTAVSLLDSLMKR